VGSASSPIAALHGLFIISITIKVTAYLSIRELEVDLSRSNVDDSIVVLRNGLSKIMEVYLSSTPMSRTIKSAGT
jgi:hypothetical protein